jgi:hypothetical protein
MPNFISILGYKDANSDKLQDRNHTSDQMLIGTPKIKEKLLKGFQEKTNLAIYDPQIRNKITKKQKVPNKFNTLKEKDITRSGKTSTTNDSSIRMLNISQKMNNSRISNHIRQGSLNPISNKGYSGGLQNYIDEEKSEIVTHKDPVEQKMRYSISSDDEVKHSDVQNVANPTNKALKNLYLAYGRKNYDRAKNVLRKVKSVKTKSSTSNK